LKEKGAAMTEPVTYFLDHSQSTVDLTLSDGRLVVKTQGKGLLDKPRVIHIPLSDLKSFYVTQTIGVQNLQTFTSEGDRSYDSEFMFSYLEGGKAKSKRVFVNSQDPAFQRFLSSLGTARPDASLLNLPSAEALKQIGTISASKSLYLVLALIVAVPVLIILIVILSIVFGR
jgi:hypothetical protein